MSENQWNENDDAQMPLGVGGEETPIGGEEKKKIKINPAWLLLGVVFAAGIGLVYVIGKQGGPQQANAEQQGKDAQFQASLQELSNKPGTQNTGSMDTDALVKLFKTGATPKTHEQIAGNPFELPQKVVEQPKTEAPVAVKQVEDSAEAQRLLAIGDALKKLKVTSIMYSANAKDSLAMIGKDMVQVGSKVGLFTVTAIEREAVVVEANGEKYPLKMAKPGGN